MPLLVLQHVPFEGPACIRDWAEQRELALHTHCCASEHAFPLAADYDGFIIMGGPMGVNDEIDWLQREKLYINELLQCGKPVLGICLGAQLMAHCLGASVAKHRQREIGWYEVCQTGQQHWLSDLLPERFTPLHWHGDSFAIPSGAKHLLRSAACENQAFALDEHIIGLQFHLEFDPATATRVGQACADELADGGPSVQSLAAILAEQARFPAANTLLFKVLDQLFNRRA